MSDNIVEQDLISREAVHGLLMPWLNDYLLDETREILETIDYKIEDLPSVQPKQRTGRWVLRDDINGQYQCEECGMFTGLDRFDVKEEGYELPKYCSNCGRRNMEVQDGISN